jgi:S1-C subfamily serine protease
LSRPHHPNAVGLHALLGLAAAAVVASSACATSELRSEAPVPAAEEDDMDRPFIAPLTIVPDLQEESIVRIVGQVSCTGAVVGDRLVLTAHHCVAERDAKGHVQPRDVEPKSLRVELGGDDLPWGEVGVRAIVSPACGYEQGSGDIAILVLDRELVGMPPFVARIDAPPRIGEQVASFGFGRCALHSGAIHRQDREGGPVTALESGVFHADSAICPGDSGGPVLDSRREIIGVVSAAVMDSDPSTRDSAYFARIDKFQQLFSAAKELAENDGVSPAELPPYRSCE